MPALRFETLDSWRGICALLVAMMHFSVSGPIAESALVRNAYLFVDYFFVLSGFVIAHGYGGKITDGASYLRFMVMRLGRVYPLHVAVLVLFVAFEAVRLVVPALHGNGDAPFTGANGLGSLVTSLLLLNGMGVESGLTWNGPSWSISAEVWTYVAFGLALLLLGRRLWLLLVAVIVAAPILLLLRSPHFMDATYDFGFVRCLYGFSLGVLLYQLIGRRAGAIRAAAGGSALWTGAELAALAAVAAFVVVAGHGPLGIATPLLFTAVIAVFVREGGLVSQLLKTRLFLWLGTLSYGIYMLHIFVQSRLINAGTLAGKVLHHDLVGAFQMRGEDFYGFGLSGPLFGTLMMLVMLAAVIACALVGNLLIERPFQALSRRWAARIGMTPAPRANPAADRYAKYGIRV